MGFDENVGFDSFIYYSFENVEFDGLFYYRIIENVGFDGCMKDLQIGSLGTDPFDNKRAKGLVRGCTAKVCSRKS